ncbi:3-oxoadipate--succinyl-CoA transferase subunit A [Polycladomyces abyssicola]|uniref:3-oxoadipate--succinyl-CoA transferase subunit A n=1 Tax=Polycladomyces abyssicola TaxID=1125966 RepID=A0A8D5UEI1_9BACL|nr:CoA-transferase [Polycladomyces abyssicola]BCU80587.1 3-oxoadipate--succinyl-CoA transferase subunit A [Polycladomyces abyssicola]
MPSSKIMSLEDAVSRHIQNGDSVVMGACLESMIPFAAAYEIVRQKKKDLTLIAPISDILFDILIGAGRARKIIAAWSGNVSAGLGYNYRRSIEQGIPHRIEVEDHSNFSLGLALLAGSMGVPFLPTRSLLGTDLLKSNPRFHVQSLGEETLVYVPSLNPDVAILGVQRSDIEGNAHFWGNLGLFQEAGMSSRKVILLAEEIVPKEVIASDPNRVMIPGFKVTAVVHCPGFAHPSPVPGYYKRDHDFFTEYHRETKKLEGFKNWLNTWVISINSHNEYLARLGQRFEKLKVKEPLFAAPVNYAYR